MPYSDSYGSLERALHRFAFASPMVQKVLAELEGDIFRKNLESIESKDEVFITGLPRAGTTLMLELLYGAGDFETFTYREMPFILSPLLWSRLSRSFHRSSQKKERAHGDGMEISVDSPEAFDEIIWLTYLGKKIIEEDRLATLSRSDIDSEFRDALRGTIRKLLALRKKADPNRPAGRYLSKNNANISRLDVLHDIFPTAKVLVIFRNPISHINSLSGQHERFLKEHAADSFSRDYMKWIGHYEFGANFRPINFGGWLDASGVPSTIDKNFWYKYWIEAYSFALAHRSSDILFVDFDGLLRDGANYLERLADSLALAEKEELIKGSAYLRSPATPTDEPGDGAEDLLMRARQVHEQLLARSL